MNMFMLRRFVRCAGLILTAATLAAQGNTADRDWLVEVLDLRVGSIVADVGAGNGALTIAMAQHVTPTGQVYASELESEPLQRLRRAVDESGVTNVTIIEGHPNRTNLPEQCCDALFLRRVYHHFSDPHAMNTSLWQALKPGGRLAVIDFAPRGSESADPNGRTSRDSHGVTANTAVEELSAAGFTLISADQRSGRSVYVVMQKPADQ